MTATSKQKRVDELIEQATGSISRGAVFEAERMANKALTLAHQVEDYARMAKAVGPLLEARRGRRETALQCGEVTIIHEPVTENLKFGPGCYLIQPPQVGADARRLRMAALQSEVPALVVCREPLTQLKLWPVVAIGPGATVRTKVEPPADQDQPDMQWFLGAMEALGEEAIASIDVEVEVTRRLKLVLERLDTVPDHDGLHHLLEQTCQEAGCAKKAAAAKTASRAAKAKAKA